MRQLLDEVSELRDLVAGRRLAASERALLERVLPVVHRVTRGRAFVPADLFEYAEARTGDATALREALGSRSARQVGKLLARARGATIGGYRIRRECDETGAPLWVCFANKPAETS